MGVEERHFPPTVGVNLWNVNNNMYITMYIIYTHVRLRILYNTYICIYYIYMYIHLLYLDPATMFFFQSPLKV